METTTQDVLPGADATGSLPPERPATEEEAYTPGGEVDVAATLRRAKTLRLVCPYCGQGTRYDVPVDLTRLLCRACEHELDPVEWPGATAAGAAEGAPPFGDGSAPVNHRLMQRLIATCYRRPAFARRVIEHYRRDPDRARTQEWGIDKALLLVHAAHATVQRGHGSFWPFVILGAALLTFLLIPAPFGLVLALAAVVAALVQASRNTRNLAHWRDYCRPNAFDPSHVVYAHQPKMQRLLHFCDAAQPRNLFFFRGYEPFDLIGQSDENWSQLVDRRKRAGGKVEDDPAELDLAAAYDTIVNRLVATMARRPHQFPGGRGTDSARLPVTRFRIDDVALVSGQDVEWGDRRFIDADGVPRPQLDAAELDALSLQSGPRYRAYKRIAYYDPRRDLGMISFLRIAHQGAFTYIESAGTRLLPVVERLMDQYNDEPTSHELEQEENGPAWWRRISYERRRRVAFVGLGLGLFILLGYIAPGLSAAFSDPADGDINHGMLRTAGLTLAWAALLIQVASAYGRLPRFDDDWEPKRPTAAEYVMTLGLVGLLPYRPERARRRRRDRVRFAKQAHEWDYSPRLNALRVWQSRQYARTRFEDTDLLLLRRTHDRAVQEAFLHCLEEAGIDTTEFREGAALINNYGIINQSGRIEGGARVETTATLPKGPARRAKRPAQPPKGQPKAAHGGG